MEKFCRIVGEINTRVGKFSSFLIIPLVALVALEVVLRYVFNKPTIWSFDISVLVAGAFAILGGAITHLKDGHVAVDVLSLRLSIRGRAILRLITGLLFFFGIGIMVWQMALESYHSVLIREKMLSFFEPPIYPIKVIIFIGLLLLLLQGIVKFINDFTIVFLHKSTGEKV